MKTAGRSPGNRGPSSFLSRRAHLLTTRKRAVVWPSATVRSPRGIAAPAGAAGRCHSPAGAAVIVHAAGPVMGWQNAIPHSCRLPAQTCHRQLCRRDGRAPGLGRAHFLFVKRNKNSLYAGGKENEWRSIIWRRRWSAGARGAPLWPLPPI